MEENLQKPSPVTMILYLIDNDNTTPSQNWEIIPKKKYTIGRSKKEVDLPLNIKLLSRKHAELTYYDSKTIMIKDLDSRNGTFINKLKIEPLKETFFTDKDILSFGNNTNNKIMFFENNEQPQPKEEIPNTDSEKSKESDIEKDEKSEPKMEINRENGRIPSNQIIEEINTDTRRDIRTENMNAPVNNQRKERESNIGKRKIEERFNIDSKEPSRQRELDKEKEKNKELSISNKDIYENKKVYSYRDSPDMSYHPSQGRERSDKYNAPNESKRSYHREDKSRSREKENFSRSRSGSRETLIQDNNRDPKKEYSRRPPEISSKNKDVYSYDREKERERARRDYYENNYIEKNRRENEEDKKYSMRNQYEEQRRRDNEEEEYRRLREREQERYRERPRNYNDRRRNDNYNNYNKNYFEEGNRIILRPEKLDIVMNQNYESNRNNKDIKDDDMGYIKCYVEGYMYLKIKKTESNGYK